MDTDPVRRTEASVGTGVFFVLAPGVVAGVVPWWLTGWRMHHLPAVLVPLRVIGVLLVVAGAVVVVEAFVRFAAEGRGTPAPVAPTEQLVVGGLYRYVRNPMYLAVLALIVGQAALLAQPVLLWYASFVAACVVTFVKLYEEPALTRQFGAQYEEYRAAVPGWWPRLRPWDRV